MDLLIHPPKFNINLKNEFRVWVSNYIPLFHMDIIA